MRKISLSIALGMALVSSCKISEVPQPESKLQLPELYEGAGSDTTLSLAQSSWQSYFQDPKLKSLISDALANNQDNLMTLERINAAKAGMLQAKAGLFPSIGGVAGASQRKYGEYTMDGVGNYDTNFSTNISPDQHIPDPYKDFVIGANFEWELDVWGKIRSKRKAAVSRYLASEEMAKNVRTWLVAEVASHYYALLAIDAEVNILTESIRLQELGLNLITELKDGGRANQLAVDQFEALILNTRSKLQARYREEKTTEYNLARLVGTLDIPEERIELDSAVERPRVLEIGLPSQLLRLRPDIREAEMALHASKFDVAAAKAAFYPSFKLFGMAGFNAFDFSKLFLSPGSSVYQFGMGLTAPIFNRREIKTQFEVAKADQRIALLEYEKRTLNAYLEVLDLVNQIDTYENQLKLKQYEVSVQQRSIDNSNTLFSVGYANYLEVINAQGRALESAIELADLKASRLQAHVKLYRALGGGWD
ncbi:efflux transporter outer membrane subunit [Algoriphagus sp. H41]|uniref:Efflux transporter outer membrane subunit n=1 Tax=Algoriphagus oliviformis TaxID=2811231 RepID=A0ABS3C9A5_9BACT|nr:efflux transporter outer membrane subunit [Algoriphagus oliviformis]MBN7813698.1 efflux transporter outer membrane subunit [Algoriphagus oliviformis]